MRKSVQSGFTLIELMVVVVIVAILMGVALPSYRNYVLRSHRVDGKSALTQCAAIQERWFTKSNEYNSNAGACPATSEEGYYSITVAVGDLPNTGVCDTPGVTSKDCFIVTAIPTSKAKQNDDTTCATMTLDQMNVKTSKDSANVSTTAECWK